jgi:hypothetical protein
MLSLNFIVLAFVALILIYFAWRDWLTCKKTCAKISKKMSLVEAELSKTNIIANRYPYPHGSLREAFQSDGKRLGWIPRGDRK